MDFVTDALLNVPVVVSEAAQEGVQVVPVPVVISVHQHVILGAREMRVQKQNIKIIPSSTLERGLFFFKLSIIKLYQSIRIAGRMKLRALTPS